MEFSRLAVERRSVRAYEAGQVIDKAVLEEIITTTLQAPTWKNTETGRYYIANSEEMMGKVRDCLPGFNQNSTANASAYIVTTYVKNVSGFTQGQPDNELGNEWGAYDLGLQNAYMLLKAKEMGYDSLIMGLRDADAIREVLDIPEEEIVFAVIALGKREGEPVIRRRKTVDDVAKFF